MIRIEIKVVIPDNKTKDHFFKHLLNKAATDQSAFLWQTHFDLIDIERLSLEAVSGQAGFPFLDAVKGVLMVCDFPNEKQAQKAYKFFESLAISWDIEISQFEGKRVFNELVDLEDDDEDLESLY